MTYFKSMANWVKIMWYLDRIIVFSPKHPAAWDVSLLTNIKFDVAPTNYHETGLGCAEDCHRGGAEPNPWYGRHVADAHPNYGDPIAGQHNRYLASTPNSCPNPNGPLTSQLDDGSGYLAANYIQTTAGEDTTGDSAGDSTTVPSSSPEVLGVQTDSQSQYSPGTLNQAGSGSNALGIKEANALLPGIAPNSPNTANTVSNLFPDTGATGLTNINPLGSTGNTVIGSGATTTFTPSGTGATVPELGTGITTIGTTAGNTNEDLTPRPFNLGTLGGYAPLFRKRYVKSARDFRLFDFTAT